MQTEPLLEKVTAFVIRPGAAGSADELLLFEHPFSGNQLPAGTVEEGEAHAAAALREAREETGLTDFESPKFLGYEDWHVPDNQRVTATRTIVYGRPDPHSFDWAFLPRGARVDVLREADGYQHVCYTEWDRLPNPQYPTMQITGWVPTAHLARKLRRYFYAFTFRRETPPSWTVAIDYHHFRLFWARLDAVPHLVGFQDEWLRFLAPHYPALRLAP